MSTIHTTSASNTHHHDTSHRQLYLIQPSIEINLTTELTTSFWAKVKKPENPINDCWEWPGAKTEDGYGKIYSGVNGKYYRAHRVSWTIHNGAIPEGLIVCHTCDNPQCTNPNHLYIGTVYDNAWDRIKRGRTHISTGEYVRPISKMEYSEWIQQIVAKLSGRKGSINHFAVLNEEKVVQICEMILAKIPEKEIATEFNVCRGTISAIVSGKTWRHVTHEYGLAPKNADKYRAPLLFIDSECIIGEGLLCSKQPLYKAYKNFCERTGVPALHYNEFFKTILMRPNLYSKYTSHNGNRTRVLSGLILKEGYSHV